MNRNSVQYLIVYSDDEGKDVFTEPTGSLSQTVKDNKQLRGTILMMTMIPFDLDKHKQELQNRIKSAQKELDDIS